MRWLLCPWGHVREYRAKYEFLVGEAFLVAPVYADATVRDGIYLPAGTWIDYWSGRRYDGPATLDGYPAPLDRLPLFVKAGSIVPMWPEGTLSWTTRDTTELDLDVYPGGQSSFTLYEDDGVTRAYAGGEYAEQTFTTAASGPHVSVTIGPSTGSYAGKPASRRYGLSIHHGGPPGEVGVGDTPLTRYGTKAELDAAPSGWYHDPGLGGVTYVKTPPLGTSDAMTVILR